MDTPLIDTLNKMSDEDVKKLNKTLGKMLAKKIAFTVVLTVGATYVGDRLGKKYFGE